MRRIRALAKMHPRERPISLDRLEQIAAMPDSGIDQLLQGKGGMQERTRIRLSRALEWVENDQVVVGKVQGIRGGGTRPATVTIRAPQPPQVTVRQIQFTSSGPKVRFVAINPRAFPKLSKI
jgi:hypothetical protein